MCNWPEISIHLYTTSICALSAILSASWISRKNHAKRGSRNYGLQEATF